MNSMMLDDDVGRVPFEAIGNSVWCYRRHSLSKNTIALPKKLNRVCTKCCIRVEHWMEMAQLVLMVEGYACLGCLACSAG